MNSVTQLLIELETPEERSVPLHAGAKAGPGASIRGDEGAHLTAPQTGPR
jgi:hypothetical protein